MVDESTKKELRSQYKEREIIGGVYLIRNTMNNKVFIDATADLQGSKNRFEFSVETGSCVYMKLLSDWKEQSGSGFAFEVLEELRKSETQTPENFKSDLGLLKSMWLEKLSGEQLY